MSLFASYSSASNKRRWLHTSVALLLAAVQMFSLLHSLEHFEEHDGDNHSELSCNLCILSADLENNTPTSDAIADTVDIHEFNPGTASTGPRLFSPNYGFDPRAPPVSVRLT